MNLFRLRPFFAVTLLLTNLTLLNGCIEHSTCEAKLSILPTDLLLSNETRDLASKLLVDKGYRLVLAHEAELDLKIEMIPQLIRQVLDYSDSASSYDSRCMIRFSLEDLASGTIYAKKSTTIDGVSFQERASWFSKEENEVRAFNICRPQNPEVRELIIKAVTAIPACKKTLQ